MCMAGAQDRAEYRETRLHITGASAVVVHYPSIRLMVLPDDDQIAIKIKSCAIASPGGDNTSKNAENIRMVG